MALAHIRSGAVIARNVRGWIKCESGNWLSAVAGAEDGNDKIVPVEREETGVPAGPDTVATTTETVEADRVLITVDRRAMTAQEITDRDNAEKDAQTNSVQDVLIKVITNHENRIRGLEARPTVTEQQVRNFLRGLL